eukprot:3472801-Pleurochrysis_carterae.AAC.1
MLDEIRALIRALEGARSSDLAVSRVSDLHIGARHHHNPPWASGRGVSTVPKPFGPDMVDVSTQSKPLNAWLDALIRAREVARSSGQATTRVFDPHLGVEHDHIPPRASGSGVSTVFKPSGVVRLGGGTKGPGPSGTDLRVSESRDGQAPEAN